MDFFLLPLGGRRAAGPSRSGRSVSALILAAAALSVGLATQKAVAAEPVTEKIRQIISDELNLGEDRFDANTDFFLELDADTLDLAELLMALEKEFGIEIPDEDGRRIRSLAYAVAYVEWTLAGRPSPKPELGDPVLGPLNIFFGGAVAPGRTPEPTAAQGLRRQGGTATRRRPNPSPRLPEPIQDIGPTRRTALPEPTPGTESGAPTELPVPTTPQAELDEELREAYVAASVAYYAAVEKKNRVDESSFAQLDVYNAWALDNRQRVIERQQLAATVVLIVVVFLVLAGTVFSAIQFWIAMRHARLGKSPPVTTLKASLTSVEVSSSVLGITILVISLLFFYLYLEKVFNLVAPPG